MKPYLSILIVLLIGGIAGFYLGQKSSTVERIISERVESPKDERQAIEAVLQRQKQAYSLHDAMLLFRDCSDSYVEVNGTTGQSYNLQKAILQYHESFQPGKAVVFNLINPEIAVLGRFAVVKSEFSKTSDYYEQEGFKGYVGRGVWVMSFPNNQWEITAFAWSEERKP
jgi:hypothetical protein